MLVLRSPFYIPFTVKFEIFLQYTYIKWKELVLVKLFKVPLRSERLIHPKISMTFYSYTQFVSLYEDIFIHHLYYHPILHNKNVGIIVGGAHMGMFTAYCKWLNDSARIIAFEADPDTYALLAHNTKINKWKKAKCLNLALSDKKGTSWFYYDSSFPASFVSSLYKQRGLGGKRKVKLTRLSPFIKKYKIDYVKLDIEGAEYAVLKELVRSRNLKKATVYIIEFHHNMSRNEQLSEALNTFSTNGYTYVLESKKPIKNNSFQDVMVYIEKL